MSKLMLIDAAHPEETRVTVVADGQIEDFDFEARDKRQLRGNIYLAKVTRVEPSLQAAFVEYGGNRHGFLAFSEIHPDYYQIPAEDREALLREEEEAARNHDDDDDDDIEDSNDNDASDEDDGDDENSSRSQNNDDDDQVSDDSESDDDDSDSDDDSPARSSRHRVPISRRYKIQEVIKRRQVLLIQVVKEERGNKGAAVTTYLSLAGRYGVLMPNTARGGGISRKITNASDRKRLKTITRSFDVPNGMGLIIRTAGAKRTKAEISRDYDYLVRLWKTIRDKTLNSSAPCLIHEEGDLVLRAVRDLYDREVTEINVQGHEAYKQAAGVVEMLMPDHKDLVVEHSEKTPLFIKYGVEAQLDNIFSPVVTLPSGGYIVINQTEALVAIDVNSGKATRERNIETTAVKTNLEAAEEACRQMRLRDLAGLIVIDFIDMEENRNNRAVEKKMKECMSIDRARVQAGRISQFGLFEISRQRRRAGVLELSSEPCPHCTGTGRTRSIESAALQLLRAIGERCADSKVELVKVKAPAEVALYILNHKRDAVTEMEDGAGVAIRILADDDLTPGDFDIEASADGKVVPYKPTLPPPAKKRRRRRGGQDDADSSGSKSLDVIDEDDDEEDESDNESEAENENDSASGARRRRGRRGGRRRRGTEEGQTTSQDDQDDNEEEEKSASGKTSRRSRRRRVRRRTPDVALDGGEMFDAIATAPFLINEQSSDDSEDDEDDAQSENQSTSESDDAPRNKRRRRRRPDRKNNAKRDDETNSEADESEQTADSNTDELIEAVTAVVVERNDEAASPDLASSEVAAEEAVSAPETADVAAEKAADDATAETSPPEPEAVSDPSPEPAPVEPTPVAASPEPTEEPQAPVEATETESEELHALHAATPAPAPKKRRIGWWNRSGS
ncbi:MAG: ribonuclease E/G [Hirschia sp.]|nr:ribonuclease E/G [Hirschia sp.]MBF19966.1 ribonuclease E/G [Hirschia sp.]